MLLVFFNIFRLDLSQHPLVMHGTLHHPSLPPHALAVFIHVQIFQVILIMVLAAIAIKFYLGGLQALARVEWLLI